MDMDYISSQLREILIFGFASGFTVGIVILGISSVVHKITTFYKGG